MIAESHAQEVDSGQRFGFGKNRRSFLSTLDADRVAEAKRPLQDALRLTSMRGLRMLDIGSDSELFSLAAVLLDAESVHSFDLRSGQRRLRA